MGNTLFIMDYRAGSHLLLKLLLGRPAVEIDQNGQYQVQNEIYSPGRILAPEPYDFPTEIYFSDVSGIVALPTGVHRYTYMGDWWGQVDSSDAVPDPYEGEHPTRWDYKSIDLIKNWKVVRLVRNPRSHIESVRNTPGEKANPHQIRDPFDYFVKQCKSMRNRLRVALDCESRCSNYKIFKSEDLVDDPMSAIAAMDLFAELRLDLDKVSEALALENASRAADLHSTFKNSSGYKSRNQNQTPRELEAIQSVLGTELKELDY